MRTPDGQACPYYYVDHHRRATARETCHLLAPPGHPRPQGWTSQLCATCPVPAIRRANACKNMVLHARIGKRRWRFWEAERVLVRATCTHSGGPVKHPEVGCGLCHEELIFVVAEEE